MKVSLIVVSISLTYILFLKSRILFVLLILDQLAYVILYYKLVPKVLTNRLKQMLLAIIFKTRSAFKPGQLISDNIIVAYEALHSMKSRQRGRIGSMAVKLEIFKAYDKLEWNFLEIMMRRLGFNEARISKIMSCVKTVSYLVLVK